MIFNPVIKSKNVKEEILEITSEEKTIKILILKTLNDGRKIYDEVKIDKNEFTNFTKKL